MTCQHARTKVLYDQGTKAEGRKLRGVADRCVDCGRIEPRANLGGAE